MLRSGGYSRKELEEKEKDELYKLRIAALKRMVRPPARLPLPLALPHSRPCSLSRSRRADGCAAAVRPQLAQFDEMRIRNGGALTDREQGYQAYYPEELTYLESDDSMDWLKKCMGAVLDHGDIEQYHILEDKAVRA